MTLKELIIIREALIGADRETFLRKAIELINREINLKTMDPRK